jgi:hypothetical protein
MKECKKVAPLDARVNRSLSTNSIVSLSPSKLNHAIMEMLNMSQAATKNNTHAIVYYKNT